MPMSKVGLVERVLISLPQAQRIDDSTYSGCKSAFIKKGGQTTKKKSDDKRYFNKAPKNEPNELF
jgi:hypothetical protein